VFKSQHKLLSESIVIPVGSHFFTIEQQFHVRWTAATSELTDMDDANVTHVDKRARLEDQSNNVTMRKFNIPRALLTCLRCSSALAQYVLDFLDMNALIFAVNMTEHTIHNHAVLLDDKWWKRRLTHDLGSHVARWSDDLLRSWQQQWLETK
jgi:hypothetical protein